MTHDLFVATFLSSNTVQSAAAVRMLYVQRICVCSACLSVIHLQLMSVRACLAWWPFASSIVFRTFQRSIFSTRKWIICQCFQHTYGVCVCVYVLYLEIFKCDLEVLRGVLILCCSITPLYHTSHLNTWFESVCVRVCVYVCVEVRDALHTVYYITGKKISESYI